MNSPDYHHLIQQLLDGEISAEDFARLDVELRRNPEALSAYRLFAGIHCGLVRKGEIDAAIRTSPVVPIDRLMVLQRRRIAKTSALAAAAVVILSGLVLWLTMAPERSTAIASFEITPGSSYAVSHLANDVSTSKSALSLGSTIRLDHGAIELSLPHQVRAVLEAPATLTLVDDRTVALDRGRAFFEVKSPDGHGFTVETPHRKIVDLGTAFGIDLPIGTDQTHLHVFEGSVRIDGPEGKQTGATIRAPIAVSLPRSGVSMQLEPSADRFLRRLPDKVESVFVEDFESGLLADSDYAIHMDPTVILDHAGNPFAGISEKAPWRFSTPKELRIRNPSFEAGEFGAVTVPGWEEVAGDRIRFNTYAEPPATEGALRLIMLKGRTAIQNLGVPIRSGTTYTLALDVGRIPDKPPSQAVVRFFGSDVGHEMPLAQIRVDTPEGSWSRDQTLKYTATPEDETGQSLGIALSSSHGWVTFDDLRIFEGHSADPREFSTGNSEEAGPGAQPETRSPEISEFYPPSDSSGAPLDGIPTVIFDEPVRFGTGRINLRNLTDGSEAELVVGSERVSLKNRVLTLLPALDLADGKAQMGAIPGWKTSGHVSRFNPSGDGYRYSNPNLADDSKTRGAFGSMKGPVLVTLGNEGEPGTIRRSLGKAEGNWTYTVSVGIGCRSVEASNSDPFAGYRIRLLRDSIVLAEVSGKSPPGPPNSVTSAGLSWTSSHASEKPGSEAPLILEISTLGSEDGHGGELDIDHVRVTSLAPKKP